MKTRKFSKLLSLSALLSIISPWPLFHLGAQTVDVRFSGSAKLRSYTNDALSVTITLNQVAVSSGITGPGPGWAETPTGIATLEVNKNYQVTYTIRGTTNGGGTEVGFIYFSLPTTNCITLNVPNGCSERVPQPCYPWEGTNGPNIWEDIHGAVFDTLHGFDYFTKTFNISVSSNISAIYFANGCGDSNSLVADGLSSLVASSSGLTQPVNWSASPQGKVAITTFTNDAGCVDAIITSISNQVGSVKIRATGADGCFAEGELTLEDPDEGSSGCSSCGGSPGEGPGSRGGPPVFGMMKANLRNANNIGPAFSLGQGIGGRFMRTLQIPLRDPSLMNNTPEDLIFQWSTNDVEVFRAFEAGIEQVRVPQGLVYVVQDSATEYELQFYPNTSVGARGTNGYTIVGDAIATYVVSYNSDDDNIVINGLGPQGNGRHTFNYLGGTDWNLENPDGTFQTLTVSSGGSVRTEIYERYATDGTTLVDSSSKEFTTFEAGERLTKHVRGLGSDARTNTYSWYTNGLLKQMIKEDGYWEYYLYDSKMRPTNVFSSFANQSVTTNKALCRMVENSYDTNTVNGSGDAGTFGSIRPRRVIEYFLGEEISRRYHVSTEFETRDISCTSTGAAWTDANNLVRTMKLYSNGFWYEKLLNVEHPDGTMDFFEYTYGGNTTNYTNVVWQGVPGNTYKTNVVDGSKTVTVKGPLGQLISETTTDIRSGIVIGQQLYGAYDVYSRPQAVTNLDGTWGFSQRFCCGDIVTTNREGTVVTKAYDSLNRLLTSTTAGIMLSNTYDAANHIVKQTRIGNSGGTIVVARNGYDTAGELIATTNALGEVTLFAHTFGASGFTNTITRLTNSSSGPQRVEAHYLDGQIMRRTGGLEHPVRYESGPTNGGTYTREIKLDANGNDTGEWTMQFLDAAGRPYKTLYPDGAFSQSFYNSKGQPTNEVDADGVSTISLYNSRGERAFAVTDMNRDGVVDWGGTDRISWTTNYVVNNGVTDVQRTETRVWTTSGVDASTLVSVNESAVNGLLNWSASFGLTNRTENSFPGSGVRYAKTFAPDGTFTTTRFENGRAISSTRTNGSTQLSATTFGLDEHGRQKLVTDARNGTSTNTFNDLDRVMATATPTPGNGQASQRTGYMTDSLGQIVAVTNSDSTVTYFASLPTGERTKTWGARAYPVENAFTAQGRMSTMKTWQDYAGNSGTATTTWNYDSQRGWLASKRYADNTGPDYAYTPAGRLRQRTWARGTTTTYTTNAAGEIAITTYSDSTLAVTNTFDRRGRVTAINQGTNVTSKLLHDSGLVLSETFNGITVSNQYDGLLHRTNLSVWIGSTKLFQTAYSLDDASRLSTVSDGTNSATYSYVANSPLVSQLLFKQNSTTRMTTTRSNDFLNRLLSVTNLPSADSPLVFNYAYNSANQRTNITLADSSQWNFRYDPLGQVTNGNRFWSDGTAVLGQQFGYLFDDIGNRKTAVSGGDANGLHKRLQSYSVNNLNQYTSRTVPGYLDIIGSATNTAIVAVNNTTASRKNDYYRAEVSAVNSGALWQSITNVATVAVGTNDYTTNWTGHVFVPKTPELFTDDLDGNLTSDGRWTNSWDAENQLITMTSHASGPDSSRLSLRFAYDSQHRRISKVVSNWTGSAWAKLGEERYVWDGWNLIAILDASNTLQLSFCRGTDLSGSMQGAGGVGGLISLTVHSGSLAGTYFVAFDGNGNVAGLVNAADGTIAALYEYDPFGNVLRATGPLALTNSFRFSTKYTDAESGFNYYGYRSYNPTAGRWLSRDPIGERGGKNIYVLAVNNPLKRVDMWGLFACCDECKEGAHKIKSFEVLITLATLTPESQEKFKHAFDALDSLGDVSTYSSLSGLETAIDTALSTTDIPGILDSVLTSLPKREPLMVYTRIFPQVCKMQSCHWWSSKRATRWADLPETKWKPCTIGVDPGTETYTSKAEAEANVSACVAKHATEVLGPFINSNE